MYSQIHRQFTFIVLRNKLNFLENVHDEMVWNDDAYEHLVVNAALLVWSQNLKQTLKQLL